jgi:hypothetical protein
LRSGWRHGGLGLGLAIVRHLIELHGGTVRADSSGIGRGSTFTIELPVRAQAERCYCFFAVNVPSPMSPKVTLPFIVSLSTVPL